MFEMETFIKRPWIVVWVIAGILDVIVAGQLIFIQGQEFSVHEESTPTMVTNAYFPEPVHVPIIEPEINLTPPPQPIVVDPDDFEYLGIEGWDSDFILMTWTCDEELHRDSQTYPNLGAKAAAKCDSLDNTYHLWRKAYYRNKHRWEVSQREQKITKY